MSVQVSSMLPLGGVVIGAVIQCLLQARAHVRLQTFDQEQDRNRWCRVHIPLIATLPCLGAACSLAMRMRADSPLAWATGWIAISPALLGGSLSICLAIVSSRGTTFSPSRIAWTVGCIAVTTLFIWADRIGTFDAQVLFLGVAAMIWFDLPAQQPDQPEGSTPSSRAAGHADRDALLNLTSYAIAGAMTVGAFFAAGVSHLTGPVLLTLTGTSLAIPIAAGAFQPAHARSPVFAELGMGLMRLGPLTCLTGIGLAVGISHALGAFRAARALGDPDWLFWVVDAIRTNPYVPALAHNSFELLLAGAAMISTIALVGVTRSRQADAQPNREPGAQLSQIVGIAGALLVGCLILWRASQFLSM